MKETLRSCAPGQPEFQEFLFNDIVHVVLAELARDSNSILDRVGIGSSMADDRDPLDTEQWRSSELGVIQSAFERAERVLCEDRADLGRQCPVQLLAKHGNKRFEQAFAEFQRNVPSKPVATDDIH